MSAASLIIFSVNGFVGFAIPAPNFKVTDASIRRRCCIFSMSLVTLFVKNETNLYKSVMEYIPSPSMSCGFLIHSNKAITDMLATHPHPFNV